MRSGLSKRLRLTRGLGFGMLKHRANAVVVFDFGFERWRCFVGGHGGLSARPPADENSGRRPR